MTIEQGPRHQRGVEAEGGRGVAQPQAHLGRVRLAERLQSEEDGDGKIVSETS